MAPTTITKTPSIVDNFFVDFVNQLGVGEILSGPPTVTAFNTTLGIDASGEVIAAPAPAIAGSKVIFWYKGGAVGQQYILSVVCPTSFNRTLEADVNLSVQQEMPA